MLVPCDGCGDDVQIPDLGAVAPPGTEVNCACGDALGILYRKSGPVVIWWRPSRPQMVRVIDSSEQPRLEEAMAARKQKKDPTAWLSTDAGQAAYRRARASAQAKANETGYDHGLERNDLFKTFSVFMLPKRENRTGHELRAEVVSCEHLDHCKPGHGPR